MRLKDKSTGAGAPCSSGLNIAKEAQGEIIVALAGNPNVGKSTVFNALTGMRQHTGNWPGKTVTNARGRYRHKDKDYVLVDLPGTYSLMSNSAEEETACDFLCFGAPDVTVVVADATCLERNLNLVLQTLEITGSVVVCVNLMDEAKKKGIGINLKLLSDILGVPVVGCCARSGKGLSDLADAVADIAGGRIRTTPLRPIYTKEIEYAVSLLQPPTEKAGTAGVSGRRTALRLPKDDTGVNLTERIVTRLLDICERIAGQVITYDKDDYSARDRKIDKVLTSKISGIPVMIMLLCAVFWITITGANVPSGLLAKGLFRLEEYLGELFNMLSAPKWLSGPVVEGMFRTLIWVISVMLPPMAIFFPLFTLLEDSGYLPRVAFNLDKFFKKACAHGKQSLTMCMGFGCNAVGVVGCRIIDSPRERLIAVITNSFIPCNGRFPALIAIITMFIAGRNAGPLGSLMSALVLAAVIVIGVAATFLASKILSKTILKGTASSFNLELPPYRRPQIGRVIVRSIFDKTFFVLRRAAVVAAPAGLIIWALANIRAGEVSLLESCAVFLDPFARLMGMDGYILLAFILGFPANELVIPIILMGYTAGGALTSAQNLSGLRSLLAANGWNWLTAVCVMLFSLMHWPCGTTCLTVYKETKSLKWTAAAFIVPTAAGTVLCLIVAGAFRLLGLS
ncbi:MAG: ferrous iron transport protein B [Clostridiales bacterium]|nr:ferrous iron transport protein B [Clostridiales bacterium]